MRPNQANGPQVGPRQDRVDHVGRFVVLAVARVLELAEQSARLDDDAVDALLLIAKGLPLLLAIVERVVGLLLAGVPLALVAATLLDDLLMVHVDFPFFRCVGNPYLVSVSPRGK